jgi:hypothetical protein
MAKSAPMQEKVIITGKEISPVRKCSRKWSCLIKRRKNKRRFCEYSHFMMGFLRRQLSFLYLCKKILS